MARLIDADELNFSEQHYNKSQMKAILDFIDNQPTAYDPDKVVKQLEAVSYERYGNDGMGGELVVNLDDAVEIMKGGGVDD